MKTRLFFVLLMVLALSAPAAFGSDKKSVSEKTTTTTKTENKLSEEEISRMTKRIEEIRDMDKSNLTVKEKRELRQEVRVIRQHSHRGGVIYIGAGTLILIIILIILLA